MIIPTNLVCVLFGPAIPTSSFNFQFFFVLVYGTTYCMCDPLYVCVYTMMQDNYIYVIESKLDIAMIKNVMYSFLIGHFSRSRSHNTCIWHMLHNILAAVLCESSTGHIHNFVLHNFYHIIIIIHYSAVLKHCNYPRAMFMIYYPSYTSIWTYLTHLILDPRLPLFSCVHWKIRDARLNLITSPLVHACRITRTAHLGTNPLLITYMYIPKHFYGWQSCVYKLICVFNFRNSH